MRQYLQVGKRVRKRQCLWVWGLENLTLNQWLSWSRKRSTSVPQAGAVLDHECERWTAGEGSQCRTASQGSRRHRPRSLYASGLGRDRCRSRHLHRHRNDGRRACPRTSVRKYGKSSAAVGTAMRTCPEPSIATTTTWKLAPWILSMRSCTGQSLIWIASSSTYLRFFFLQCEDCS